jgi:hypothetical protein
MSTTAASLWASLGSSNHGQHLSSSYPHSSHRLSNGIHSQESKQHMRINGEIDLHHPHMSVGGGGGDPFLAALRGPHVFPPHLGQDPQALHVSLNSLLPPGSAGGDSGGGDSKSAGGSAAPGAAGAPTICFNCKTSVSTVLFCVLQRHRRRLTSRFSCQRIRRCGDVTKLATRFATRVDCTRSC